MIYEMFRCLRCGHYWDRRNEDEKEKPKVCPRCKSFSWDKPIKIMVGGKDMEDRDYDNNSG